MSDDKTPKKRKKLKSPLTLAYPFNFNGAQITSIPMRRPKGKDLKKIEKIEGGDMEKSLFMIGLLSGMPTECIDEVDAVDLEDLGTMVEDFLEK